MLPLWDDAVGGKGLWPHLNQGVAPYAVLVGGAGLIDQRCEEQVGSKDSEPVVYGKKSC